MTPKPGGPDTEIEFVYKLPAQTIFKEFAVPNLLETPSPSQLSAKGAGEEQPIAENRTEAGRSLNRRVEVVCH